MSCTITSNLSSASLSNTTVQTYFRNKSYSILPGDKPNNIRNEDLKIYYVFCYSKLKQLSNYSILVKSHCKITFYTEFTFFIGRPTVGVPGTFDEKCGKNKNKS